MLSSINAQLFALRSQVNEKESEGIIINTTLALKRQKKSHRYDEDMKDC